MQTLNIPFTRKQVQGFKKGFHPSCKHMGYEQDGRPIAAPNREQRRAILQKTKRHGYIQQTIMVDSFNSNDIVVGKRAKVIYHHPDAFKQSNPARNTLHGMRKTQDNAQKGGTNS